jgi:DNA-binding XRE family transcriptional regulator
MRQSQGRKKQPNNVRALREEILMSKAELARKAGVSALTIDRIENGSDCRLDTKRKIILALGKKLQEKTEVFPQLAPREDASNESE